jgi:ribose transport system permease protein
MSGMVLRMRVAIRRQEQRFESLWIFLILAGIVLAFAILTPSGTFFTLWNLKNVALDASQLLILASGMTFILISASIDLSVGAIVVFCSIVAAKTIAALAGTADQAANFQYPHLMLGLLIGIPAAVAVGVGWGLVNGGLTVKLKIPAFIATLGTASVILGFSQVWTGGQNVQNVPLPLQKFFGFGELAGIVPWPVVTAVAVVVPLWVILARTRFGLRTYAIGSNPEAARRAGINVNRHFLVLFALMGLLCGIVGFIDIARFNTASVAGHTSDALAAISAAVIGGTSLFGGRGRMSGTVVGAFIPPVLQNGFVIMGVQAFWQHVAVGCVLLIAVYLDQLRRRNPMSL